VLLALDEVEETRESTRLLQSAAEQGHALAKHWLCYAYDHGRGIAKNHAEALRWWRKAAGPGRRRSQEPTGNFLSDEERLRELQVRNGSCVTNAPREYGGAELYER
jgi:hypothetical protein